MSNEQPPSSPSPGASPGPPSDNGKRPQVVAIIPARGGSKGLPRKNLLNLAGKPLIAYSIETALATPSIDRVVVSTDDPEIARVASDYGAEVPFLRPPSLASDTSLIGQGVEFFRLGLGLSEQLGGSVVVLYPTSPFRSVRLMEFLVGKLQAGHGQVNTVHRLHYNLVFQGGPNAGRRVPVSPEPGGNREDVPYFRIYGVFTGFRYVKQPRPSYYHVLQNEVMRVDIDTREDFLLAERIIKHSLFDFVEDM